MQQQQVISIPGHEITNPIMRADKITNGVPQYKIVMIHPIMLRITKTMAMIRPIIPKQNVA
jgi:hypothetical protein